MFKLGIRNVADIHSCQLLDLNSKVNIDTTKTLYQNDNPANNLKYNYEILRVY